MIPTTTPDVIVDPALFELGFKHGQLSMMRSSLAHDKSYMVGFRAGLQFYTSSIPAVKESPDEVGWGDERLNPSYGHGMI